MIIFSNEISKEDIEKLEALDHVVVRVHPSCVSTIDDGGDVHAAVHQMDDALVSTRNAVYEVALCLEELSPGNGNRIIAKLNESAVGG